MKEKHFYKRPFPFLPCKKLSWVPHKFFFSNSTLIIETGRKMISKAFSFTLLIVLVSFSSCFGYPIKFQPTSKNCHYIDSESPNVVPQPSLPINRHKVKFPNFNQFNHGVVRCARRRPRQVIIFNVVHFGAKADGKTDASEVLN